MTMKAPHLQADHLAHTRRRMPVHLHLLSALLLSLPAYAIDIRIDPPPSPEKALRGLGGFFHRVFNDSRNVRAPRNNSNQQVATTTEFSARSRQIAAYRPQDTVTAE